MVDRRKVARARAAAGDAGHGSNPPGERIGQSRCQQVAMVPAGRFAVAFGPTQTGTPIGGRRMANSSQPKRTQVGAIVAIVVVAAVAAGGAAYYANHTRSVQLNADESGRHHDAVLNMAHAATDAKAMAAEHPTTQPAGH